MNLLLHIRVQNDQFHFYPPLVLKNAQYFDVDNFSSSEVIHVAFKAIEKSERLMIYFETIDQSEVGQILKFITATARFKGNVKVIYKGHHPKLVPLINKIGGSELTDLELREEANAYFN